MTKEAEDEGLVKAGQLVMFVVEKNVFVPLNGEPSGPVTNAVEFVPMVTEQAISAAVLICRVLGKTDVYEFQASIPSAFEMLSV